MSIAESPAKKKNFNWVFDILLILVLLVAAYFRFTGSDWGEVQYQQPDELFLRSVTLNLTPVHSLAEYFDTTKSTLNPANTGNAFYVYGDLPVILVRYLAQSFKQLGNFDEFARQLSALADVGTVALLYFIVKKIYKPGIALLAALFSSLAVMQIQESHYYTTDNFATFFMFLALYFAAALAMSRQKPTSLVKTSYWAGLLKDNVFWLSLIFGLTFGMAIASKLTAYPLALLLPVALAVRYFKIRRETLPSPDQPAAPQRPLLEDFLLRNMAYLLIGGLFAVLSFRVFQPYAFVGLELNPQWLAGIREQRAQATPDANLDWALQWARRTHLYSFENLTKWGLGLPLGILAWAGFLWMAWRMLKGEWLQHFLLWSWTAGYFVWQSLQYNPTMRYQLPIYPLLAMMAAWLVFRLWEHGRQLPQHKRLSIILKTASISVGTVVLLLTAAWAYAFLAVYTHPEPRIAASNWIYQNVPAPINLEVKLSDGTGNFQQPLPLQQGYVIPANAPFQTAFTAQANGILSKVFIPHALPQSPASGSSLQVTVWQNPDDSTPLTAGELLSSNPSGSGAPNSQTLVFSSAPLLNAHQAYTLKVEVPAGVGQVSLCGPLELTFTANDGLVQQTIDAASTCKVDASQPYLAQFVPNVDGFLSQVVFSRTENVVQGGSQTFYMTFASDPNPQPEQVLATASVTADFSADPDPRGAPVTFNLDRPVSLAKNTVYYLNFQVTSGGLTLTGGTFANETDLDWSLPFRLYSYDPFGGLYRGDLNLQVYWDDNADKLARFENTLDQADYIFIPTNHQYGQTTRIPERFPLTTVYYRELLGCPPEDDIIACYRKAEPGMYKGSLGFELVKTFEDYPTIGPLVINDQSAEEAFTFYDHPKVLIFKKSADYSSEKVAAILGAVDTSTAIHLTPGQADKYKSTLLSSSQLSSQQAGGTWSDLFNREALYNRFPGLGLVLWYLLILALGVFTYPLVRAALPGLADHGYPLARVAGLLLWAWFAWLAGSLGLTYSRLSITASLLLIVLIGAWQAWRQRHELVQELRTRWKYFLLVEILFLGFFMVDLLIRLGNSDLWHPAKGGERPMDFAYLNAILKSTSFPPYDPWFAGGYINYYYYGYVIVGTPVKFLGIIPSIAYNFILPTIFACLAVSAFSVGWNFLSGLTALGIGKKEKVDQAGEPLQVVEPSPRFDLIGLPFIGGISAASALVLLGNLGIVKMLYQGFQEVSGPGDASAKANIFLHIFWAIGGFIKTLAGKGHLPFSPGDWYWNPSRALPASSGSPITEFPLFTFIYSDLHAHMIALMLTVLAIAWALSVLLAKARWKTRLDAVAGFFLGALVLGAIKPTNTWDFYTYLILGASVLAYSVWRYASISFIRVALPDWIKRLALALAAVTLLVGASLLFYQPYSHWYLLDSGYTKVFPWTGGRSDLSSYLVHWGVFLFFIVSFLVWETRQWLAQTPLSAVKKLRSYRDLVIAALAVFIVVLVVQQVWIMQTTHLQNPPWKGVTVLWLALPLAVWAAILLLFRPGLPDTKRLVLFMIGTGLLLSMVVEIIVMGGDIDRMNTVFKLYLQGWVLLGISAAACFGWLLSEINLWHRAWRFAWNVAALLLVGGAALFILEGGWGKVSDRMSESTPRTLDSMTYMDYSTYNERGPNLDLSADYRAIQWMQDNVQGSPVIAEAPSSGIQYEWFNRFSIYTGLPDVIGWEWHQIQQRVIFTNLVRDRGREEDNFYTTSDLQTTLDFLKKYNVRYIIVGQLEHAKYAPGSAFNLVPPGSFDPLVKFEQYNGTYWHSVYRDDQGQTVIYEVGQ